MPVVTRSCGRKATTRRRIEDPTPRACRTTVKRKKDASDEEIEKPPKKKPSIEAVPKTVCEKKNEGIKKSRIPRRCLSEKKSVTARNQIANNRHDNDDEEELLAKKKPMQTRSHITENKDHNDDEVDELMTRKKLMKTRSQVTSNEDDDDDDDDDEIHLKTTVEEKNAGSPQEMNVQCVEQQTPWISPVASRTRSYSVLKKSYMRKKRNKEIYKTNAMDGSLISTSEERDSEGNNGKDSLQGREEAEAPHQVTEIDSSTCDDENNPPGNCNDKEMNDDSFKKKFLDVVQSLKKMQEEFDQAHQKTCENIADYDAFIKDLKSSLEQEKRKNATIEEELKQTREQLFMTQKEIEWAKTNEQQQHEKSISTSTLSSEPSQSEESSQSESKESEKIETSTLLAMIKFYTELTGITLSTNIPPSNSELIESFCCTYQPKGPSGQVMQFHLMYDKEIEEYEYSPRFQSPKRGDFLHKLSEHFKENFYFTNDQAHSFLASLIKAVKNL